MKPKSIVEEIAERLEFAVETGIVSDIVQTTIISDGVCGYCNVLGLICEVKR